MAKRLLLNVLVKVLGEFIELDENNLSLGVWSGQIILTNLKLKADNILRKFNFVIYHGSVKSLEIIVPWASLLNSPLKIKLDGILLDIGPVNTENFNPQEVIEKLIEEKLSKLKMMDEYLELTYSILASGDLQDPSSPTTPSSSSSGKQQAAESGSYLQQWTTRIIDNIELTISNLHVRYEDNLTIPQHCFAVGVTLESFVISTCDDHWQPAFVSHSSSAPVNKLATLLNLGIYWDITSEDISKLPYDLWSQTMTSMIHIRGQLPSPKSQQLRYLLTPNNNSMYLKLIHHKLLSTSQKNRFEVILDSNNLKFQLDSIQYKQLLQFYYRFTSLSQIRIPHSYRPIDRPKDRDSVIAWWKYAIFLIKIKTKYIKLIKLCKKAKKEDVDPKILLTKSEIEFMNNLEIRLPSDVIKKFYQLAYADILEETRRTKQREMKKENNSWGWGWFQGPGSDKMNQLDISNSSRTTASSSSPKGVIKASTSGNDISLEGLLEEFDRQEVMQTKQLLSGFKVTFISSSDILLSSQFKPMMEMRTAVSIMLEKNDNNFKIDCQLTDLAVKEVMGISPFHPYLVSVKSDQFNPSGKYQSDNTPTVSISLIHQRGKTKMTVAALPIEIYLNKSLIQALLAEFKAPVNPRQKKPKQKKPSHSHRLINNHSSATDGASSNSNLSGGASQNNLSLGSKLQSSKALQDILQKAKSGVEIEWKAHAPKIILPEDCSKDNGFLLLDCGYLELKGSLYDAGFTCNMSLNQINAGLPLHVHDLYSLADHSLYLIKPFDFRFDIQNIDKQESELTMKIDIQPEIRGCVESVKLARLLRVSTSYSDITNPIRYPGFQNSSYHLYEVPIQVDDNEDEDEESLDSYRTPLNLDSGNKLTPNITPQRTKDSNTPLTKQVFRQNSIQELIANLTTPTRASISSPVAVNTNDPAVNPLSVSYKVLVSIPTLALDLSYYLGADQNIVFAVEGLNLEIVNRVYDRRIYFNLMDFSIQDSSRCKEQRHLAWTPRKSQLGDDINLFTILYTGINSKRSPYYKRHAMEVEVNFAELLLNVDVNTITHLKPFFEVLLDKSNRGGPAPPPTAETVITSPPPKDARPSLSDTSTWTSTRAFTALIETTPIKGAINQNSTQASSISDQPQGMYIDASLGKISLDILRTSALPTMTGIYLDTAFSIAIADMKMKIDYIDLMTSEVRLRGFEILDNRLSSKDNVFRNLFSPSSKFKESSSKESLFQQNGNFEENLLDDDEVLSYATPAEAEEEEEDLLILTYTQESKSHSFITVFLSGVSSFVSIDSILDFAFLAMGNFFALTGLFSSPPAKVPPAEIKTINSNVSDDLVPQLPVSIPETMYTMNCTVKMVNSRLILLEDPALKESRALVGQCALEVHYTKETKTSQIAVELFESVHVTVSQNEIFVLQSMQVWNPLPILEPFDVEMHFKRNKVNEQTIYTSLQVEMDSVEAKLSFNDVHLAHSIFSRRSLVDKSNTAPSPSSTTSTPRAENTNTAIHGSTSTESLQSVGGDDVIEDNRNTSLSLDTSNFHIPSLMVRFGLGSLSVVLINDFASTSIPVVKLTADETNFFLEGTGKLKGEGSTLLKIDYFNSPILIWEPVLESWRPTLTIQSEGNRHLCEISSDHTMQVTLSGAMLQTLLKTYTLFIHDEEERARSNAANIVIINCLGEKSTIEIYDSASAVLLAEIPEGSSKEILSMDQSKKAWQKVFRLPNSVDIIVKNPETKDRQPILGLPFRINKPKSCILQPVVPENNTNVVSMEPIEEEIFENARFDPISRKWRKPYMFNDPPQWTDATGSIEKSRDDIRIQSEKWEWFGDWEIDMDGIIGREIDINGWEYAPAFGYFTMVSPRRVFQPMDLVKRRRWIRTRIPKYSNQQIEKKPLTLIWDVKMLSNGSRFVELKSCFQIINNLGIDIKASLQHSLWPKEFDVSNIPANSEYYVPLLYSIASQIRFRPVGVEGNQSWSSYYTCNTSSYDCKIAKDIYCGQIDAMGKPLGKGIYFRMWVIRENKAIKLYLVPYITITNKLLCHMHYRISNRDKRSTTLSFDEEMVISGSTAKLKYISATDEPKIAIQIGTYDWSEDYAISLGDEKEGVITLDKDRGGRDVLPICILSKISANYCIEVEIYFKIAMVDRSSLNLCVRSTLSNGRDIIRSFNSQNQYDTEGNAHSKHNVFEDPSIRGGSHSSLLKSASQDLPDGNRPLSPFNTHSSNSLTTASGLIVNIQSVSMNHHEINKADVNSFVYVDSKCRWYYLPPALRGQTSIKFSTMDRLSRANNFFQFSVSKRSVIFILFDAKAALPKWPSYEGFVKTTEVAVAKQVSKSKLVEFHYIIFAKRVPEASSLDPSSRVTLRGAWEKDAPCMYSVFIAPEKSLLTGQRQTAVDYMDEFVINNNKQSILRQISYPQDFLIELAGLCWTEGCQDIAAFYSSDNLLSVRTSSEESWSDRINVDTRINSVTKASFEIACHRSNITYQLSYSMQNLPGIFQKTQLIEFMPKYCIVNCMDESLFVAQKGSNKHLEFHSHLPEGWHKIDNRLGTEIKFRTQSTIWSLGAVDINDIGSSVLYIPYTDNHTTSLVASPTSLPSCNIANRGLVLHVEVKLAKPEDHCSIIIVVWQETVESQAAMSINNDTDVAITIRQAEIEFDHDLGGKEHLYELTVPPGKHYPFGWTDPESGTSIHLAVGNSLQVPARRIATINLLKYGHRLRLPYTAPGSSVLQEVIVHISTSDAGHVLHVTRPSKSLLHSFEQTIASNSLIHEKGANDENQNSATYEEVLEDLQLEKASTFTLHLFLSSFGVSLVVEKPVRREFFSLYLDGCDFVYTIKGFRKSIEFSVMDLQLDNYSETTIYPVLLRSKKKEIRRSVTYATEEHSARHESGSFDSYDSYGVAPSSRKLSTDGSERIAELEGEKAFITLTVIQDTPLEEGKQPIFKYIAFRILSLAIDLDSGSLRLFFLDFFDDLKILSSDQALAMTKPQKWFYDFNYQILSPTTPLVNVIQSKLLSQQSKIYIKHLIIHPIKITISFYQTTYQGREKLETLQSNFLNAFAALVGVEKMQLRLSSFEVEDAMESVNTLTERISAKTLQDLQLQAVQMASSLAVMGAPIGFARKVGSGVKAFFYEPYLGAVHGSQDFFHGLSKGSKRLFTGVVTGAMDSAAAFVGTASKSITFLTGDNEYIQKRALRRQQHFVQRSGVYSGFKDGSESVISGFSSGMSGLISKPFEEAAKGGVQGFFKGIGLGLLGAAVKPLVGITEGLTSIAHGISSQVDPNSKHFHVRPPRALEPSSIDPSTLEIVSLSLDAAFAQEFVMKRAHENGYEDSFLSYIPLENKGEAVILSNVYVYWRKINSLWGRVWANVSHCIFMTDGVGIMLYSGKVDLVIIPCGNKEIAKKLYSALVLNTHRMGNPSKVVPLDLIDWNDDDNNNGSLYNTQNQQKPASSLTSSPVVKGAGTPKIPTMNNAKEGDIKKSTSQTSLGSRDHISTKESTYYKLMQEAANLGQLDGYRFGTVNGKQLLQITGTEADVLTRAQYSIQRGSRNWKQIDEFIWRLLWDWGCIHSNLASCRCCVALFINRSDSPIQITRVQMLLGRNVILFGSDATGYEQESRLLFPKGYLIVFIMAFPQSPIEIGHLKASINSAAFTALLASTQRESSCEGKAGFQVGFLEKTVTDWWCKYVIVIS